ncbi:MAG: formylglycine-generating enzyme family protein [Planctomycetes bacterium]|nr:formylglycine-generating enzyme family protein [Planctomycetota bacterium]
MDRWATLPGESAHVGFRVVQAKLDHVAEVTFTDTTTGEESSRTLRLLLHEPLSVEPAEGFAAIGMFGGPFTPDAQQYILASDSAMLMDWQVTVTQDGARWLDINDQSSDSGELSLDEDTPVDIALADATGSMSPGDYAATVRFTTLTTGHTDTREFTLAIAEPLDVFPSDATVLEIGSIWSGPPLSPAPATTFELTNRANTDIVYAAMSSVGWITLDGDVIVEGTLEPHGHPDCTANILAQTTDALDNLPIGEYEETITFANNTAASQLARAVRLVVRDPLWITPAEVAGVADVVWEGEFGGPFSPTTDALYTIENKATALSLYYEITVEGANWLELDGQASYVETLPPGGVSIIPLSLNDNALALNAGVHTATVQFADVISGHTQQRIVELSIGGDLAVTPTTGLDIVGRPAGPFAPVALRYTLTNVAESGELVWSASTDPPVDWIVIDGHPSATGILAAGSAEHVLVSIDTAAAGGLTSGVHSTVVNFSYDGAIGGRALRRSISLTVAQPTFTSTEQLIPAEVRQPDGPVYSYMMAVMPTTNQEFVAFLNDALANLGEVCKQCERGQYMYFDALTGDVYINDSRAGAVGNGPSALTTKMFSPATAGQIIFNGTDYEAVTSPTDYSLHPVTGVSWYGAAKFCNWLTLDQGMPASQRCYTEAVASDLDGWHPTTISDGDWVEGDLTDLERATLARDYRGYRLPMDHQSETASTYNEWYKAAAWDPTAFGGLGANRDYGFGRDVIDRLDANFRCSGDPFENAADCTLGGTTPVGFYNGVNTLADGTPTRETANAFGLYDLTGNIKEWMQGRFGNDPGSLSTRTIRGGGWGSRSDLDNLKTYYRSNAEASYTGFTQVGFRVLRTLSPTTGDGDYDSDVDQTDHELMAYNLMGPGVGTPGESSAFDFDRDGDVDLADWASFQNAFTDALP